MKVKFITYCLISLCLVMGDMGAMGGNFSVTLENDLFYKTDRNYTHGTKFFYLFEDAPDFSFGFWDREDTWFGIGLAQHIYTPSDISLEYLQEDDRPYGGWLYLEALLFKRDDRQMDMLGINLGVTGEESLAGQTQILIHDIFHSREPKGWDHQINTEIGLNLGYQKKYRWRHKNNFDIIPQVGGCIGNIFTYANVGCELRAGHNIPDNFGSLKMEPVTRGHNIGIYLLGGYGGRYVLRNIFLDGNTWEDSHKVDKENWVNDLYYGAGFTYGIFEFVYSFTYRSKEFKKQELPSGFSSITLSWGY